jgi:hypothetical protein
MRVVYSGSSKIDVRRGGEVTRKDNTDGGRAIRVVYIVRTPCCKNDVLMRDSWRWRRKEEKWKIVWMVSVTKKGSTLAREQLSQDLDEEGRGRGGEGGEGTD